MNFLNIIMLGKACIIIYMQLLINVHKLMN